MRRAARPPIGILMFANAAFMSYVVGKDKQKIAKWEALHGEENE